MRETDLGGNWVLFWQAGPNSVNFNPFSVDGWSCVTYLGPNYGGSNEDIGDLLQRSNACTATFYAPNPAAGHHQSTSPPETPGHSQASLGKSLVIIRKSKWVSEKHQLLLYWVCQSLWLCGSQQTGKFFKRWEYQTTLPASWKTCMQVKKQQLELGMEQ